MSTKARRTSQALLVAGTAVPVLYFGTLALGGWMVLGYSHLSQYASELGMAIHLAPLLLALALRSVPELETLRRFLVATTILMLAFLLPMMGVGGLVTKTNVGVFQRLYALVVFGWIGVASYALLKSSEVGPSRSS